MSPITHVILLTSADEAAVLGDILRSHNPKLALTFAMDRAGIVEACANATPGTRLISFCSPVIVPGEALSALPGPAYNFHPGPPHRPGRYPSVFAVYDGDSKFGITVHEMAAKVDSGPIVAVDLFDVPPGSDLAALERLTYVRLADVFRKLAKHLASYAAPLPHLPHTWSGRKTTRAQAMALAAISEGMSREEIARRKRACGQIVAVEDPGWPIDG